MANREKDGEVYDEDAKETLLTDIGGLDKGAVLGSVYSLETFSTTDGPGIRTNVFLQGCPKKCLFCCNPETQALSDPKKHPEFAVSSSEVATLVAKYKQWLKPRDGGITVSGGEAMIQPDFVADLFQRVHTEGMTTCLDTACYGNKRRWDTILPHTDNVLLCLKGMDDEVAALVAQATPKEMAKSKEFARHIRDKYPHIRITPRWVLLRDLTDTDSELDALANFAKDLGQVFNAIELIPYHELGREKYQILEMAYPLEGTSSYKIDDAILVQKRLEGNGVRTILSSV
jgi:pyruvate formate lyase activating enzyme